MMLSEKVMDALNAQVSLEGEASAIYLAIAIWCDRNGINGCANFFYAQSDEERMHMLKIIHYINEMDGVAIVPAQAQPPIDYDSIQSVFEQVYQQERKVTASIYNIFDLSQSEKDHSTSLFLQWYVDEQREEEAQIRTILDKIKLIGNGPQSLFYIDKEVDKLLKSAPVEEETA